MIENSEAEYHARWERAYFKLHSALSAFGFFSEIYEDMLQDCLAGRDSWKRLFHFTIEEEEARSRAETVLSTMRESRVQSRYLWSHVTSDGAFNKYLLSVSVESPLEWDGDDMFFPRISRDWKAPDRFRKCLLERFLCEKRLGMATSHVLACDVRIIEDYAESFVRRVRQNLKNIEICDQLSRMCDDLRDFSQGIEDRLGFGFYIDQQQTAKSALQASNVIYQLFPADRAIVLDRLEKGLKEVKSIREELLSRGEKLVGIVSSAFAREGSRHGATIDDLKQEARLGLLEAMQKYDHRKGENFLAYANHYMRGKVSEFVSTNQSVGRVPTHIVKKMARARRNAAEKGIDIFEDGISEEQAKEVGATMDGMKSMISVGRAPVRLDEVIGEGGSDGHGLIASDVDVARGLDSQDLKEFLVGAMAQLSEDERELLMARFGFAGNDGASLAELGRGLGVTPESVRLRVRKAVEKLAAIMGGEKEALRLLLR